MSLSKEINAITECSICAETFVDPRVLPCVHTFCFRCLETYGKSRNSKEQLTCPICRANFEFPTSKTFSDLPVNFFIQKLIDVNKIACGPSSNSCDTCLEQDKSLRSASFYCFDCCQNLCENCCPVHNKMRYNKKHNVVEFGKTKVEELLKVSPTFCDLHSDELVKFFCTECEMTICMSCYVEDHSAHKCSNILKASDEFLNQLKEDTSKVTQHIAICMNEEEKLTKKKVDFLRHVKRRKLKVKEIIGEIHELADAYKKQLLQELDSVKHLKLKELQEVGNNTRDLLTMMESFKQYSEEVMRKATPADITRLTVMLKKRATELHAMRLDNDFCTFDIEITFSNLSQTLTKMIHNQIEGLMVCHNRKEDAKAFSESYTKIRLPSMDKKNVCSMTSLGSEFYMISTGNAPERRRLIGAEIIKLSIPATFYNQVYQQNYSITNITQCNSVVFQLFLWYCELPTGDALELQLFIRGLTESDGKVLDTKAVFDIQQYSLRQPSNINTAANFKANQKIINGYVYGICLNCNIISTTSLITVNASASFQMSSTNYPEETTVKIPFTTTKPANNTTSALLEVFEMDSDSNDDTIPDTDMITMSTLIVKLPDSFAKADGSEVNRANLTQCDSAMIHLQLSKSQSTSSSENEVLVLKVLKLSLSDSGSNYVPTASLDIKQCASISNLLEKRIHDVTLKSTQKLISNGFYGINFRISIETTWGAINIEAAIESISTVNEEYPAEAKIEIPAQNLIQQMNLRRTINIPKTTDPSDMVSCAYHQCIYIGDRHSSCILRMKPSGKITRWSVNAVPDGLATTADHNLLVAFSICSEVREYDTNGTVVRCVKLTDVKDPVQFLPFSDTQFIIISRSNTVSESSLKISDEKRKTGEENLLDAKGISSKKIILFARKEPVFDVKESTDGVTLLSSDSATGNETRSKAVGLIKGETSGKNNAQNCQSVELKGPIYAAVDKFGFVFLLTSSDAKVHLLSPQLNYLRELISLDQHGMTNPSRTHFDNESGTLYVGTKTGYPTLLGFQVTEEKVDPSVWKK